MGATPQGKNIAIEFECQFRVDLQNSDFSSIMKATTILTWFRWITLRQLQIRCKRCGSKQYITRMLPGMEPKKRVPDETRRKLALMGALTSCRVSAKIGKMFGWAMDKMTIWKSVQQIGARMDFALDGNEEPQREADGTGVGITGIPKRSKELKILAQYKKGGGILGCRY